MASVSSLSSNDAGHHIDVTTTTASASPTRPAALPAEQQQALHASNVAALSRRTFHPDINTPPAQQHAPFFLHGFHLREQTLANVSALFNGADDMSRIGREQDQQLANELCRLSAIEMPAGAKPNDGVVLPPDVMAYWVRHGDEAKMLYACPEINGTGFGGIATMPPAQFRQMMNAHRDVANDMLKTAHKNGEQPLLLIANSGREGAERTDGAYLQKDGSKMTWEKAHVADHYARQWKSDGEENFPDSLDKVITPYYRTIDRAAAEFGKDSTQYAEIEKQAYAAASKEMDKTRDKPLVLLGFSIDVAAVCRIEDGRPVLFGRAVNGLLNDRAAENLNMVQGGKLDYKKVTLINSTVDEGVNKFAAALARAEFANSEEAAALPRIAAERGFTYDVQGLDKAFHYQHRDQRGNTEGMSPLELKAHYSTFFRGVTAEEGIDGIMKAYDDFMALGHGFRPLFKPNGSGQAKGIIAPLYDDTREQFRERFEKNLEENIKGKFGAGAGYPFEVEILKELARTPEGENYDLRYTIVQGRQPKLDQQGRISRAVARTIESFPLLWKREPAPETVRGGPLEFSPTNITAAVAKTGRPAEEFVSALSSAKGISESGMNENLAKSIGLYFSAFYAFLLKTRYAREPEPQLQIGAAHILPFPARGAVGVTASNASAPAPRDAADRPEQPEQTEQPVRRSA